MKGNGEKKSVRGKLLFLIKPEIDRDRRERLEQQRTAEVLANQDQLHRYVSTTDKIATTLGPARCSLLTLLGSYLTLRYFC